MLGEDHPGGDRTDLVPGPPHPLQAGGHRRRGLHLHHQVDRAHVDAEFERTGGDHRRQLSRLERLLDLLTLLFGDTAVVGAGEYRCGAGGGVRLRHDLSGRPLRRRGLSGELVESGAQPLRAATGVGEHDRRAVGADQLEHALFDSRPDRRGTSTVGVVRVVGVGSAQVGHVLDRHLHAHLDRLLRRWLHHGHRRHPAEEGRHLLDRAYRRGQTDPLRGAGQQRVQPLQRERQMSAALGARHRVHLVDDDRLHPAQRLPRRGSEQEKQRLRGGDQNVGWTAREGPSLLRRGVPGPHPDRDLRLGVTEASGGVPDPGQRGAQVALDVDRERLEWANVEHPAAASAFRRRRAGGQPVQRP